MFMLKSKSLVPSQMLGFGLAVPVAAFSLLGLVDPAKALTFSPGDTLSITSNFDPVGNPATTLNFDFKTVTGATGSGPGAFGATFGSTGPFVPYITAGNTTAPGALVADYQIFDADFSSMAGIPSPFLQVLPNPNGSSLDKFTLSLTSFTVMNDITTGNRRQIDFTADGLFQNGQPIPADVAFQGQIRINNDTGIFQLDAQAIPEPLTMLGVGTAVGFGGFFKRQLAKKRKKG